MLTDFFNLNAPYGEFASQEELLDHFGRSSELCNVLYRPDELAPKPSKRPQRLKFEGKTFVNVSFSKTAIRKTDFKDCTFKDCLFIGTVLSDCEFHGVTFQGCNTHKIKIENCYLDPQSFSASLDPEKHQNIGTHLYNELLRSSDKQQNYWHWAKADAQYRRWKRFELWHSLVTVRKEAKKRGLSPEQSKRLQTPLWRLFREWLPSLLHDKLTGYGHEVMPFVGWTGILIVCLALCNLYNAQDLGILVVAADEGTTDAVLSGLSASVYYTVGTMTSMGFSPFAPATPAARVLVSAQALLGLVWLSLLGSIVVKKVVR